MSRPLSQPTTRVVIAGGSLAGVTAAATLRRRGFDGQITIVGEEPDAAYTRPPLSKAVLAGRQDAASVMLRASADGVEVRTGVAAQALDLARRRVLCSDGDELTFDSLVIATGARARTLGEPRRERVLRTLGDALALRDELAAAQTVLVVGGGFLGMEIASVASDLAKAVTVVDLRAPLSSALGPFMARLFVDAARERGVELILAPDGLAPLYGTDRIEGVRLADGTRLLADVVVTAIGDEPNVEWLQGSGLELSEGLVVDRCCRAAPGVVAAGDVTRFPFRGAVRRMPHWENAVEQASVAAATLLDHEAAAPYEPQPYYWTDAFGIAAKIAGRLPAEGSPAVLEGSVSERSALLQWAGATAAAINHRLAVPRLKRLAAA